MWTPVVTLVQRWFSVRKKGVALGILSTGFGLGFATMGQLFPVIVKHWDWRYCWYMLGIAAICMIPVNALLLRSKPEDKGYQPWGTAPDTGNTPPAPPSAQAGSRGSMRSSYAEILVAPHFWFIGLSYFLIAGALYIITTYMVDYARYQLGFPYAKASMLATIHGFGQIIGVLTIGMASDVIGRRMTLFISNLFLCACMISIFLAGSNELRLFVSIGVFGAFYGATFPMYSACGGDYFRKEIMGTVIGALTLFYGFGAIVAHRVAAQIRDATGSFSTPFIIAIIAAFFAAALMLCVKRKPPA